MASDGQIKAMALKKILLLLLLAIPLVARLIRAESEADRAAELQAQPGGAPPAL